MTPAGRRCRTEQSGTSRGAADPRTGRRRRYRPVALVPFGTWIITMVVLMGRRSTRAVADTAGTARGVRAGSPHSVVG
jgi:hypothetical protein